MEDLESKELRIQTTRNRILRNILKDRIKQYCDNHEKDFDYNPYRFTPDMDKVMQELMESEKLYQAIRSFAEEHIEIILGSVVDEVLYEKEEQEDTKKTNNAIEKSEFIASVN